jgi:hypothetical protein
MKLRAISSNIPPGSEINARLPGAYFYDCHTIAVSDNSLTALGYFLSAVSSSPRWVETLMALRNKAVRLVGLKDLGGLGGVDSSKPASDYLKGDRVGIFTLISNTPDEALLGDKDKHLEVVLAVYKHPIAEEGIQYVSISTVVHVHNLLGRIYMLPVTPLHKLIAPAVLSRIGGR